MNGRVMKKDEFVERMLADQEARKEAKREAEKKAFQDYISYVRRRSIRIEHKRYIKNKKEGRCLWQT